MMESMKEILANKSLKLDGTVNSTDKSLLAVNSKDSNINTVNSNSTINGDTEFSSKIDKLVKDFGGRADYLASELASKLGDTRSIAYYTLLAKNSDFSRLTEALALTLDAEQRKAVNRSKAVYFQGILKNWGIQTKFRRS